MGWLGDTENRCPECRSNDEKIHGVVFDDDRIYSHRCENSWHDGTRYDELLLTPEDKKFLADLKVTV